MTPEEIPIVETYASANVRVGFTLPEYVTHLRVDAKRESGEFELSLFVEGEDVTAAQERLSAVRRALAARLLA